jgi:hypothetical protein
MPLLRARTWLRELLAFAVASLAVPALAQSSAAMPFYVSDRFQHVAERAAQEIALELLVKACPEDKPLCHTLVENLRDATAAALSKDKASLKTALNAFFVSSSSAALLDTTMGDLVSPRAPAPGVAKALAPVARCLSAIVDRKVVAKACALEPAQGQALVQAILDEVCKRNPGSTCQVQATRLAAALSAPSLNAGGIARALAPFASLSPIGRPDLEIYLKSLAEFLDRHPEAGLFDASFAFVSSVRALHLETSLLNGDFSQYALLSGRAEDFRQALTRCGQAEALAAWQDAKSLATEYRAALIVGARPERGPIDALLGVDPSRCPTDDDKAAAAQLKSFARTLEAQLEITWALQRFSTVGLLAATAIDFARSGNEVELDSHIRRTILFGLAQLVARARMELMLRAEQAGGPTVTAVTVVRAQEILRSCEFQNLAILEQLPIIAEPKTTCIPVAGGAPQQLPGAVTVDLGAVKATEVISALDAFASVIQRERPNDYDRALGALLTTQSGALVAAISAPLSALAVSPADSAARKSLQEAAVRLAADSALSPAHVADVPGVDEVQFSPLLTMTDRERTDLLAIPKERRTQREARLAATLADPALAATNKLLTLPPPHRLVLSAPPSREARVATFFQSARGVADNVAPDLQVSAKKSGVEVDLIVNGITAGAGGQDALARKLLLNAAADFLVVQVSAYTDRLVGSDASACAVRDGEGRWKFIWDRFAGPCVVKVLIEGAYKPIAEFVWADDFTFSADSSASLADKGYRALVATPVLRHTMVLFNVGLGASIVVGKSGLKPDPNPADSGFVALTLLDKLGVAITRYRSQRTQFEAGLFVGGFLDALVRAAADNPDKYWIGGATAGWTRMWGVDLGLQLHAGWALPFTFHTDPRPTLGGTLVVPFSYAFE